MSQDREGGPGRWLLITVSTAHAPASLRVYVWRHLRLLGAVYLHQSVCVLPDTPGVRKDIGRFASRVRHDGGTVRVIGFQVTDDADYQRLVADFNQARDLEYAEVLERVPSFLSELAMERSRGHATYAEVEESEADLERFRSWLARISKRDYFGAPQAAAAREAVERCARELAAFEEAAFKAEGSDPAAPGAAEALNALNGRGPDATA
jgi:hypothetical protein